MDFIELKEISRVLCSHEEMIQSNRTYIFIVTSKVHDIEQQKLYQIAYIMGSLVQLKQQIAILEVECGMMRNPIVNLHKYAQLGASNQRLFVNSGHSKPKEDDTMH
jgi:hypothetical protein